jgi:hypothetical protein
MAQFESIKFQPQRPLLRELSADRLNTVLQEIRRNKPKGERGITVRQSGDGTYIGLAAAIPVGGGGAAAPRQPWDIYVEESEGEEENITYTLKVQPGLIAGVLPRNYEDEFAADRELHYGIVKVSTDGEFITGAEIAIQKTLPQEQTPQKFGLEAEIEVLFGLFYRGSNKNLVVGEIKVRATNVLAVPAETPTVGSPPFDVYYLLQ